MADLFEGPVRRIIAASMLALSRLGQFEQLCEQRQYRVITVSELRLAFACLIADGRDSYGKNNREARQSTIRAARVIREAITALNTAEVAFVDLDGPDTMELDYKQFVEVLQCVRNRVLRAIAQEGSNTKVYWDEPFDEDLVQQECLPRVAG